MFDNLNHFKSVISYEFYIKPADGNYYFARWSAVTGFYAEFYWQAAQTVEKYLKAILVLNNIPVPDGKHNLVSLFEKYKILFEEKALKELTKPNQLHESKWRNEPIDHFVSRLSNFGDPNIRYGQISWFSDSSDLFKLDQIAYQLRRETIGKDWIIGKDWDAKEDEINYVGKKFFDILSIDHRYEPRERMKIPQISSSIAGEKIEDAFYAWNFPFHRDVSDLQKPAPVTLTSQIGSGANSYIFLLYERIKDQAHIDPCVRSGIEWMVNHIKLHNPVRKAFLEIISDDNLTK